MGRPLGSRLWPIALALLSTWSTACFPPALERDGDSVDTELETSDTEANDADLADTSVADTGSETDLPDTDTTETSDSDTTDAETDTGTNACGGLGTLSPGAPGQPCGPCLDGELVCDPGDPAKNRTVCEGDTARNACSGCGPLEETLGAECGECGQIVCDGTTGTRCAEPTGGCETPLTCLDLGCENAKRTCIESDGELDARCDACLETWLEVDGACLGQSPPPTDVTASTDLDDRVVVSWSASLHATAYRVYRCPGTCDENGPWTELLGTAVTNTSLPDQTATAPPPPPAPSITASTDRPDDVSLSWSAVAAPPSPRFSYRVVAVAPAGESAPSATAVGHLAERPITSYELKVASGPWQAFEGFAHTDTEAAPPTLTPGTVVASQGTFPDKVALSLSGWANTPGAERTYQIRARTRFGPGAENSASGRRRAGPVSLTWERSAGSGPEAFAPIPGATGPIEDPSFEDTDPDGIPPFGVVRHYRARLQAAGASPVVSTSTPGWRTHLPGVPQIVSVSTDIIAHVQVAWSPVGDALAYHVYRDGVRLTSATGITCGASPCQFVDAGAVASAAWQAPTALTASTNRTTGVTVAWTMPSTPTTTSHQYEVSALNSAGESAPSPEVAGWRGFPALSGVEVRATSAQTTTFTLGPQATSYDHTTAPLASFSPATLTASQGEFRARVELELTGGTVGQAPNVTYEVRAVFAGGSTPWSTTATGRRAVAAVPRLCEYANDNAPETWIALPTETCPSGATGCDDNAASPLGLERQYRVTLTAVGATSFTTEPAGGRRLAFVVVNGGFYSMCAIDTLGRLWTWGRFRPAGGNPDEQNWSGSLTPRLRDPGPFTHCSVGGIEGEGSAIIPPGFGCGVTVAGNARCGTFLVDEPLIDLAALGSGLRSLDVGTNAACAISSEGQALCWGRGAMLGNLLNTNSANPVVVKRENGSPLSELGEIEVGGSHVCARSNSAELWCWGENGAGQLGDSDVDTRLHATVVSGLSSVTALAVGQTHTCAMLSTQELRCFGQNAYGELGDGTQESRFSPLPVYAGLQPDEPLGNIMEVEAFHSTTCAVRTTDTLCWGEGWEGQRGDGTFESAALLPRLVQLPGVVTGLGGGRSTACAIVDGSIWCWGANHLGDGTTAPRATPGEVTLP